jgi:hypothetical protein
MMSFWKKLQNPFALVGQGFVLGGLIFFASHAGSLQAAPGSSAPAESLLPSGGVAR